MLPLKASTPLPKADRIAGLVEQIVFRNEENGFSVVRLKVDQSRNLTTIVGQVASIHEGEWIRAEGEWQRDRQHGLQLKASSIQTTPPTSLEGIERYLGSGLIKGIGPVYAKKLVAHFGEKIFDIIEQESVLLEQIEGIGPERRKQIKASWEQQKNIREVMVFLHTHGMGTARAIRVHQLYGQEAVTKIQANPYCLAKDIPGIGFQRADQMAQKMGIPREASFRIEAGLIHCLNEAAGEGHCAKRHDQLLEGAQALLQVPQEAIEHALHALVKREDLIEESFEGSLFLFLPPLHRAEKNVASMLHRLREGKSCYPPIHLEKALEWVQEKTKISLAPQQRCAVEAALQQRLLIITGGPGVGKTTIINAILKILRAKKVACVLAAPTGRAAKRLQETTGAPAKTIHRLLEQAKGEKTSPQERKNLQGDLFVIDEASMVDIVLLHRFFQVFPLHASLLLVGDVDQLPSVGPGNVLGDFIASGIAPTIRLTEIFRQASHSQIIQAAHQVNQGQMPQLHQPKPEGDFFFLPRETPEAIQKTVAELVTTRLPQKLGIDPIADTAVLTPMNRGSLGTQELNGLLQEQLNPVRPGDITVQRFGWQYRPRDKVMQTRNNYDKRVFNGDIGRILHIDPEAQELMTDFEGERVVYSFAELDDLVPAYAMTIHKSQGSEFPAVIIPLATQHYVMLQRNLLYTAMTRGKKMVLLVGQEKAIQLAIHNHVSQERVGGLLARLCI